MAKSETFVVAFKSNGTVLYSALDSRDSLIKSENPLSFKKFFTHDDARAIVKALRIKGLEEGVEVRAKSLAQSVRDYSWQLLLKSQQVESANSETLEKVLKRYEVKKTETKPAKAGTSEEVAEESNTETTEA